MNIAYGVPILAPQTTGHPAGLPADTPTKTPELRVAEPSNTANTGNSGLNSQADHENAPPTAMQRQIMEILEQQAEALADA